MLNRDHYCGCERQGPGLKDRGPKYDVPENENMMLLPAPCITLPKDRKAKDIMFPGTQSRPYMYAARVKASLLYGRLKYEHDFSC